MDPEWSEALPSGKKKTTEDSNELFPRKIGKQDSLIRIFDEKKEFTSLSKSFLLCLFQVFSMPRKSTKTTASADNQVLVTADGLKKLKDELEQLKTVERKAVANRLAEAISYGDLSENAEYDEAKNQQAFVEQRISELEEQIKNAKIIKESTQQKGVVQIGSTVVLRFLETKEEHEYTIVGSTESDPTMHRISNESPVGAGIIGKPVKSKVEIQAPGGTFTYEILKIS